MQGGSLTLTVDIDASGAKVDIAKLASDLKNALANGDAALAKNIQRHMEAAQAANLQLQKVEELQAALASLSTLQPSPDNSVAYAQYEGLRQKIADVELELDRLNTAKEMLASSGLSDATLDADIEQLSAELRVLQADAEKARLSLLKMQGTDVQAQTTALTQQIQNQSVQLELLSSRARIAGAMAQGATRNTVSNLTAIDAKVKTVSNGFGTLGNMIAWSLMRVAVYSTIGAGLRSLIGEIGAAIMSNENFRASLNNLQSALWTAFAPIYSYVVPALTTLINFIASAINSIVYLISVLTGASFGAMQKNGKALRDQTNAYKSASKGAGKAAKKTKDHTKATKDNTKAMKDQTKEAEKQLAAFDDLEILQSNLADDKIDEDKVKEPKVDEPDGGGGGGGAGGAFADFGTVLTDITTALASLQMFLGGVLLAIGIILLFIGAPKPIAIGCIIAGIMLFSVGAATLLQFDPDQFITVLATLTAALGGMLLAIGVILLMVGSKVWGIACIIAGVALLVTAAVTIGKFDSQKLITTLLAIEAAAGGAMLALGIILLYFGVNKVMAIGLIIAGVLTLGVAAAQLMQGKLPEDIQAMILKITTIVSSALLAIGIILILCGVYPLGIGCLVAGAAGLATAAAINPDGMSKMISEFIQKNSQIIIGVGIALIVLGVILICCGVYPLGIGLLVAGGAGLWAAIPPETKDSIVKKVQETWNAIKEFWNSYIAPVFTKEFWQQKWDAVKAFFTNIPSQFKQWFTQAYNNIKNAFSGLGQWAKEKWNSVNTAFKDTATKFKTWFENGYKNLTDAFKGIGEWATNAWKSVTDKFGSATDGVEQKFTDWFTKGYTNLTTAFQNIGQWATDSWKAVTDIFGSTSEGVEQKFTDWFTQGYTNLNTAFENIGNWATETWKAVTGVFGGEGKESTVASKFKEWFQAGYNGVTGIFDQLGGYFSGIWATIQTTFSNLGTEMADAIGGAIKTGLNGVISWIESTVNKAISLINGAIDLINNVPGVSIKKIPYPLTLPRLAQGAVIPPNRPFAAILGDQRSGYNIETPLETMVQAFTLALDNRRGNAFGDGNMTVVLEIDGREFGRAVVEQGNIENRRIGTRLVTI